MTSDTGRQAIPTHPAVRIGDAEREHVAVTLGEHFTTGRLTTGELERRLGAVYAATTRDALDDVLIDLPAIAPPRLPARAAEAASPPQAAWTPWALTAAICLLVWAATSLAQGRPGDFWPIWVIGPWGLVLLARAVRSQFGDRGEFSRGGMARRGSQRRRCARPSRSR